MYGEHAGNLYGIRLNSVRWVLVENRICLLDLHRSVSPDTAQSVWHESVIFNSCYYRLAHVCNMSILIITGPSNPQHHHREKASYYVPIPVHLGCQTRWGGGAFCQPFFGV